MARQSESLRQMLRKFVTDHPHGWDHHAWERLLGDLRGAGLKAGEPTELGLELERMRVLLLLEGLPVKGLGPKRREAVATLFPHVWDLQKATTDELLQLPSFTRKIAEDVLAAIR